ncbi:MAG: hypothetical protein A3B04_00790 [Candidatus Portnoybacteria bacterium RIFCSPLOWO2_02_FULL_39_11]|uniref:WbqC-like protein n=1 Tax=Candidatus Portnoybacteria bacterium RIFCSPLOWO2_02_FULL_39_11 TaxID=1802001 RepID=A0A1G2FN96_9BACT|nr:MAG: hypothetical protein A3B04_00790 [Candidatus Portnoybacteria bacterium RIFCSPLOWO2_02_FULL_39_11]
MILTAHQPAYLPWLGLFHKIALSDAYVCFDDVQFERYSFINRNKIRSGRDETLLTVPLLSKNHFDKKIKEMEIDNSRDWRNKHWKSIYLNYQKAPFFNKYVDFFEELYKKEWHYLIDLTEYSLEWFLAELGIKVQYARASEFNFERAKSDLILDMCKKMNANFFIFGALGGDYAEKDKFAAAGVKIYFQEYRHPQYRQTGKDFLPYMSIIDLLFNEGDKSLEILMSGNISQQDLLKI